MAGAVERSTATAVATNAALHCAMWKRCSDIRTFARITPFQNSGFGERAVESNVSGTANC
jgi:hypothetical protein